MTRLLRLAIPVSFFMALMTPVLTGIAPVSAATKSINTWIDISATRPEVGCLMEISVEVRDSGQALPSVEVELALHVADTIVALDRAITNENGIAFLELDTSDADAGVGHWLDINMGGEYLTGLSIVPSADGGCSNAHKLLSVKGDINYVPASASSESGIGSEVKVSVPRYSQQRSLSCEYAALHIATSAFGSGISEYAFDDTVGWSANPHVGYRGDINGVWGRTDDYGVYNEPLSWALDNFGFNGDAFYAVGDSDALTDRLDQGKPVLVWLGLWGDESIVEQLDGRNYTVVAGMHVMVAYGYDAAGVYLSDPGTGTYRFYSWGDFMWMWNILDGMGLAVSPA